LRLTDGIWDLGGIRLELVITLALAWICVFFCLFKGVGVLGKVRKKDYTEVLPIFKIM